MAYSVEVPRSRLGLRVSILALVAAALAGCSSDVTRFDYNPFASNATRPSSDVTGSIPSASTGRVEQRPLPQPRTAALPAPPPTNWSRTGAAARGRPAYSGSDVTGSIPAPSTTNAARGQTVVVKPGMTLAAISRRYGVSIAALMRANHIAAPNNIQAGQRLVIPVRSAAKAEPAQGRGHDAQKMAASPAASTGVHVAGPGETLYSIARRYHVSEVELARANHIEPYAGIRVGQRLAVPGQQAAGLQPPGASGHTEAKQATPGSPAPVEHTASVKPAATADLASPADHPFGGTGRNEPSFRWPVHGHIISAFGSKPNGQENDGINISVPEGTPIKAAEGGEVAYAGDELKGYGNLILVRHPDGYVTAYAHASKLLVKRGDKVRRGEVIAKAGATGNVTSPQLHFEIRKGSTPVDPMPYLGG